MALVVLVAVQGGLVQDLAEVVFGQGFAKGGKGRAVQVVGVHSCHRMDCRREGWDLGFGKGLEVAIYLHLEGVAGKFLQDIERLANLR